MANDPRQFKPGEHLVDCDICGRKRYRSECGETWDGFIACYTSQCWYPKDPLFYIPPVINDPAPVYDVRPAPQTPQQYPQIPTTGFDARWNFPYPLANPGSSSGVWSTMNPRLTWNNLDTPPSYMP